MTIDESNKLAFELVALAGDARSQLLEAFGLLKNQKFDEIEQIIKKANDLLTKCHQKQFEMLSKEAQNEKIEFGLLMVHGQDHLMTSILLRDILTSLVEIFKTLKNSNSFEDKK